jgi:C-terminal processing protease CtpA/Prc
VDTLIKLQECPHAKARPKNHLPFFGRKTAGFTSANRLYPLPNGGTLALTTSMTEDRNGVPHPEGIEPDVVTATPFADAAAWLRQQCAL